MFIQSPFLIERLLKYNMTRRQSLYVLQSMHDPLDTYIFRRKVTVYQILQTINKQNNWDFHKINSRNLDDFLSYAGYVFSKREVQ